ncbi:FAD dependent oxidoreductase [Dactylonectria macrodidyma]|uniref:FAD dependent oxidoreductase n=1 Tax=Dactylonectria macrodidyma TaxID=307937 RepID=A0A9P9DU86_9HYPO|nr:FAD dependent oxidoreductase [Dactylonectria macrodidyma]
MGPHPTSLPVGNPTSSYWLSQPHPQLQNFCSSEKLPAYADTVIIGSGISGSLIAHELCTRRSHGADKPVIMLEARSLASGATGRNGGHIKPDCYKNFASYQRRHGTEVAKSLCRFELDNMRESVKFITEQGLAETVDLVETKSVDFFMTQKAWVDAQESLKLYSKANGDLREIEAYDKAEAENKFRFSGICGAVTYPACSLWPYKLAVGLVEKAVANGMQLFTHTAALKITPASERKWQIHTSRGPILCDKIFHATNGYVSHLLPELTRKVVPVKGNVIAMEPSPELAACPLPHTAGVQWGEDFDYMIQRPVDGKPLIYGGGDLHHKRKLLGPVGDADDSTTTPEIVSALLRFPIDHIRGWGPESIPRYTWSGVMGLTADGFPFVGGVPGRPGQFASVGYTGHGMARVVLTIRALMQAFFNEPIDSRVPQLYFDITKRLEEKDDEWEVMLNRAYETAQAERLLAKF